MSTWGMAKNVAGQLNRAGQNFDIDYMRDEALAVEQYRLQVEKAIKDQTDKLQYMSPKERIDWHDSTDPLNSFEGWMKTIEPQEINDKFYQAKQAQAQQLVPTIETFMGEQYKAAKQYHFTGEVSAITTDLIQQGRTDEARAKVQEYVSNQLLTWDEGEKIFGQGMKAWALETATNYALDTENAAFFDGQDLDLGAEPQDPTLKAQWLQARDRQAQAQQALSMLSYEERQKRQQDTKLDINERKAQMKEAREQQWDRAYNEFSDVLIRQGNLKGGYEIYNWARNNRVFTADGQAEKMLSQLKGYEKDQADKANGVRTQSKSQIANDVLAQVRALAATPVQINNDAKILAFISQAAANGLIDESDRGKADSILRNRTKDHPIMAKIAPTASVWALKQADGNKETAEQLERQALAYYFENVTQQFGTDYTKITPEWEARTWRAAVNATTQKSGVINSILGKTEIIPANRTMMEVLNNDNMKNYFQIVADGSLKVKVMAGDKDALQLQAETARTINTILVKELNTPGTGYDRYFKSNKPLPVKTEFDNTALSGTGEPVYFYQPSRPSKYDVSGNIIMKLASTGIVVYDTQKKQWIPFSTYAGFIDSVNYTTETTGVPAWVTGKKNEVTR
jgi:hypothetical protein